MIRKPIQQYALLAQTATTAATGSSGTVVLPFSDFNSLVFKVLCSAASATASLDLWIQTTDNGGTTWYDCLKFPTITASSANPYWGKSELGGNSMIGLVGASTVTTTAGATGVPLLSNTLRAYWNLAGTTPSASFTVTLEATEVDQGGL